MARRSGPGKLGSQKNTRNPRKKAQNGPRKPGPKRIVGHRPQRPGTAPVDPLKNWKPGPHAMRVGNQTGMDLAHFLQENIRPKISVRSIRRYLAEGKCRVNGRVETYGSRKLIGHDIVEFTPPQQRQRTNFERKRLIYDQDDIVAYDKPAGIAVTPTDGSRQWHLLRLLRDDVGELLPVHRIDADTSGIVLFARTERMQKALQRMFRERQVRKNYRALVRARPRPQGERRSYLIRKSSQPGWEKWGTGRGPGAVEAITQWTVEEQYGDYGALVKIEPQTGRHHQIRIHFSEMASPLFGDRLYGDRKDPIDAPRHLLHASYIDFKHPFTGQTVRMSARMPADFNQAIESLKALKY